MKGKLKVKPFIHQGSTRETYLSKCDHRKEIGHNYKKCHNEFCIHFKALLKILFADTRAIHKQKWRESLNVSVTLTYLSVH